MRAKFKDILKAHENFDKIVLYKKVYINAIFFAILQLKFLYAYQLF